LNKIIDFYHRLNRRDFLDREYWDYAKFDNPLPIGFGQTISQPTLVLQMTDELDLNGSEKVLEIGTGSGYQTAFLAEFSESVYTVERIPALSEKAQKRLARLGYRNIHFKIGDGSFGWEDYSPYDRVIVTAAVGRIPETLVSQLREGGIMIIPVGPSEEQELVKITKDMKGNIKKDCIALVRFVELVGDYGWDAQ
jgi:protein-L-isoaspartate(D-aspartate) O-methyltransferase